MTTIKAFTPIRPELSLNNLTLESTSENSYMWFLDGIQINGADGIDKIIFSEKIEIENNVNHTIDLGRFSNGIYSARIVRHLL